MGVADKNGDNSDDEGMEMIFKDEKNFEDEEKAVEKMTPWEKYLHKKKEKRKQKKRPREEIIEDNEEDQNDDEIPSDVDLNDPFFKEELSSLNTAKTDKAGKKKRKTEQKNAVKSNDLELLT